MEDSQLYTTAPAAREAKIAESTLRTWAKRGLVPFRVTPTGVRLYELPDVLRVARERGQWARVRNGACGE